MSEADPQQHARRAASFGAVAEAYDRARPGYPREAVDWMVGPAPAAVVELGAGTGKLTEVLSAAGHRVLATDPSPEMLRRLARRTPTPYVVARAEQVPTPSRAVDVVACGQSFHWFDHDVALREIARVLRPGGVLARAGNVLDTSIPWVRRLDRILHPDPQPGADEVDPLTRTPHFGFVEERRFRFWQPHTKRSLQDHARSTSYVAGLAEAERDDLLARLGELYDAYGRGHDGMQVPWVTVCSRAVVRHQEDAPVVPSGPAPRAEREPDDDTGPIGPQTSRRPPEDPGVQLIDLR